MRNARHQRYCAAAACKAASKRASQAKWLAKNPDYHRGPKDVARVKAWRPEHPEYSRRERAPLAESAIQETWMFEPDVSAPLPAEAALPVKKSCNAPAIDPAPPLQDFLNAQPTVLIGLISHIWGSTLQDDIASALTRLLQLGQAIRGGEHVHANQAAIESATSAPGAGAFQLARSSAGAGTHHLEGRRLSLGLYLFLVTVADACGLSYYSEASLCRRLQTDAGRLARARRDLIALDLIAYDTPLYQALSLPESVPVGARLARLRVLLAGHS